MISSDKIKIYFNETIKFQNWNEVLLQDKYQFLTKLIQKIQYHSYFHNIFMAAVTPEDRVVPRLDESITSGLFAIGGVCIHHNEFLTHLLKDLGFHAFMTSGSFHGSVEEGTHCVCIVKLSASEIFALDVGCGNPINEPIPLHALPYGGLAAGFRYEYRYNEADDVYERWQLDGTFFRGKYDESSKDQVRYKFNLIERERSFFDGSLVSVFCNPEKSIFLKCPMLFRSLDPEKDAEVGDGRKFVLIFGASMVIYDTRNREVTEFASYLELQPSIERYFPKLDSTLVKTALENCRVNSPQIILGKL